MEYATIGNTDLLVSKLCFGAMTFGDGRGLFKAISTADQARGPMNWSRPRLTAVFNFLDTADNYTH
jgi:aryl-alcohol dehydrogenase-like predicted oxidoreductase